MEQWRGGCCNNWSPYRTSHREEIGCLPDVPHEGRGEYWSGDEAQHESPFALFNLSRQLAGFSFRDRWVRKKRQVTVQPVAANSEPDRSIPDLQSLQGRTSNPLTSLYTEVTLVGSSTFIKLSWPTISTVASFLELHILGRWTGWA